MDDTERYRDALEQISNMMGPQGSQHTKASISCEGCFLEWEEVLRIVRNVLNGKEADDHWGEFESTQ